MDSLTPIRCPVCARRGLGRSDLRWRLRLEHLRNQRRDAELLEYPVHDALSLAGRFCDALADLYADGCGYRDSIWHPFRVVIGFNVALVISNDLRISDSQPICIPYGIGLAGGLADLVWHAISVVDGIQLALPVNNGIVSTVFKPDRVSNWIRVTAGFSD